MEIVDLLGLRLDPEKTPPPSSTMTILGVLLVIICVGNVYYAQLNIDPRKQSVWLGAINKALQTHQLLPCEAEVLAGRLEFAASAVLGKGHRHRLITIYAHGSKHAQVSSDISSATDLLSDLQWWANLLSSKLSHRMVQLTGDRPPPLLLYTDAEGKGGLGAVLFDHGCHLPRFWFSSTAPTHIIDGFSHRRTQIVPLEALAVFVAIQLWGHHLRGQRVILMVDNVSVVGALIKGSSRKRDINVIIGATHMMVTELGIDLFVHWVPSRYNVSDLPSRGRPPAISGGSSSDVDWASVVKSIY